MNDKMETTLLPKKDDHFYRMKRIDTLEKEQLMSELKQTYLGKIKKPLLLKFTENLKSGIVVGMVNLPMVISFAVASGATPMAGVISGIWGGIFGGLIGGSYYNILGPAGGLIAFLSAFVLKWGADLLPWCAIVSGIFSLIILVFNLGKYIDIFPSSVNEGFTFGIAFNIFFGQMTNALGIAFPKQDGHTEESIIDIIGINLANIDTMNQSAMSIFILFFFLLFILTRVLPKIPWIVVLNILGIIIGYFDSIGSLEFGLVTLQKKFGDLSFTVAQLPIIPDDYPYFYIDPTFYVDSLKVAFIVVLECLISAKIADSVTNTRFHLQRELKGLYITHFVVGAVGGFPVTASLPRTALNIRSGATHKYSSLISSIVLLLLGLIFFPFFKFLPLCVIASIMCYISIKMVNFDELGLMWKEDKQNFNLFIFVSLVSILTDAIVGVFLGLLVYQMIFSEMLLNPYSEVMVTEDKVSKGEHKKTNLQSHFMDIPNKEGKYIIYRFVGVISFMNIDIHKQRIISLAKNDDSIIVLSLRYMNITDITALEALKQLIEEIENNDVKRKIPKNYHEEFTNEDGIIVAPEIDDNENEQVNNYLGKKIIITGLTQNKFNKFKNAEWFHHLRDKGQLILSEDIKLDSGIKEH